MKTVALRRKDFPRKVSDLPKAQQACARSLQPALAKAAEGHTPLEMARMVMAAVGEELSAARKPQTRLAMALVRGIVSREELKEQEGGSLSSEEAGKRLGISKAAILKRYQKGQLLAWREAKQNAVRFPVWQFDESGVLPGLAEVLAVFNGAEEIDSWAKITFFLNPLFSLGSKRPLDLLRAGEVQKVIWAAESLLD